jgi:hypothetical protein
MTRARVPPWTRPLGDDPVPWLVETGPPWVKLGVLRDLLDAPPDDPAVRAAREDLHRHPLVAECLAAASPWPEPPLRRHDEAKHPLLRLKILADLGVDGALPGLAPLVDRVLGWAGADGQLRSLVREPETQEPLRIAFPCDAPILLGVAVAFGRGDDPRVQSALEALEVRREADGGWFCHGEWLQLESSWRRRPVSCPLATLHSLWALSLLPVSDPRRRSTGAGVLIDHFRSYDRREGEPLCHFQAGKRYRRLKFPYVWYDVLYVLDVLMRFDDLRRDRRLLALADAALGDPPPGARYKAGSAWMAYKGYDFGQKREPSPTVTFLLARALRRMHG